MAPDVIFARECAQRRAIACRPLPLHTESHAPWFKATGETAVQNEKNEHSGGKSDGSPAVGAVYDRARFLPIWIVRGHRPRLQGKSRHRPPAASNTVMVSFSTKEAKDIRTIHVFRVQRRDDELSRA
jgi:hypothetical protein